MAYFGVAWEVIVVVLTALFVYAPLGCKAQLLPEVCNAINFGNEAGSIPKLSDQFSLWVEVTLINYNSTALIIHELYDSVNNRGGLTVRANGTITRVIYNYEEDEIFFITDSNKIDQRHEKDCQVHTLSQSVFTDRIFGITMVNGSLHIGTTGDFFNKVNNDTPTNYMGLTTIRGIPTLHWQACLNEGNLSFTADYYYTTPHWNYAVIFNPGDYDMIPIQISVQGLSLRNGSIMEFSHIYSIFDYHTGPDSVPDSFFSVPTGLACTGRIPGDPLPSISDVFSMTVQHVSDNSHVRTFRVSEKYRGVEFMHGGFIQSISRTLVTTYI